MTSVRPVLTLRALKGATLVPTAIPRKIMGWLLRRRTTLRASQTFRPTDTTSSAASTADQGMPLVSPR
jgi:hypothetical protein